MENKPKQTAVDYLFERLEALRGLFLLEEIDYKTYVDEKKDAFIKAKEMQKQQKQIELTSDKEIIQWAKKQSEIEPTGAEEFGRIYGAKWMRDKIQGGNNEQQ